MKALRQAAEQNRLERFFAFPNFKLSAERCGEALQEAGLSEIDVESRGYDGEFYFATGVIPGTDEPEKEILFVTHLYSGQRVHESQNRIIVATSTWKTLIALLCRPQCHPSP